MKIFTDRDRAALKAAIPKLAPLVGADKFVGAYEAFKILVDSRREERVNRYCLALLSELDEVDLQEINSGDENLDIDFGDLLQSCMDDSDSRKPKPTLASLSLYACAISTPNTGDTSSLH